jgi:hypothetical protein
MVVAGDFFMRIKKLEFRGDVPLSGTQRQESYATVSFRVSQFHEFGGWSTAVQRLRQGAPVDIDTTGNRPRKPIFLDVNCNRNTM